MQKFNLQPLESRQMFAVSMGADGWHVFAPSADTRTVYVSSSAGSDNNNGLSASSPVKSFTKAKSLVRDYMPDQMLLKRGDTFGAIGKWNKSGRSASEPMVIGAYGEGDRPIINSGTGTGFATYSGSGHTVDNIAITSLDFVARGYDGKNGGFQTSGIRLTRQGSNYLVEDVRASGFKDNIVLDGDGSGISNFAIRRSESLDAFVASSTVGNGHAQGIYVAGDSKNVLIEENIFDHNGWKAGVSGAGQTMYNHNMYINTGAKGVVVRGNISTRASLRGTLLRAGGTVQDNLYVADPVAVQVGNTASVVTGNTIIGGVDLPSLPGAVGIDAFSLPSATIANNVIAHEASNSKYNVTGIRLATVSNADVHDNVIYDWQQEFSNGGTSNVSIHNNEFVGHDANYALMDQKSGASSSLTYAGNIYSTTRSKPNKLGGTDQYLSNWASAVKEVNASAQSPAYADASRDMGDYNASIGGANSFDAWINAVRNQSKTNWDPRLSAAAGAQFIRDGFQKTTPLAVTSVKSSLFNTTVPVGATLTDVV